MVIAVSAAAVGVYPRGTLQTFSDCCDVVAAAAGAEKMLGKKQVLRATVSQAARSLLEE